MSKNLEQPKIEWIRADKLFVDPDDVEVDRQRKPEERGAALVKKFGAKGERFSLEHCGALKGKRRGDGMIALKDGGGRWWVVMNLLKAPELKLPVVIMENTSDLEAFRVAQESIVVPKGKIFMALGASAKNKYENAVCNVLHDLDFTTTPGHGKRSLRLDAVIFAFDLGVLHTALKLAGEYWLRNKEDKHLEGMAVAGLAAFVFTYKDEPGFSMARLRQILEVSSYQEIKDEARKWLPRHKEHQRQWSSALAKELITRYNLKLHKSPRINPDLLQKLQSKLMNHPHYDDHIFFRSFYNVWDMRKVVQ